MRMRRRFKPMLDSMPSRIAPSSLAVLPVAVHVAPAPVTDDSDPPETTGSTPIIIAPPQPPGTLPC
jgi:hypothetical protein